ncbi:hypothetical protein ACOMHN_031576 [Nucella lapillus]
MQNHPGNVNMIIVFHAKTTSDNKGCEEVKGCKGWARCTTTKRDLLNKQPGRKRSPSQEDTRGDLGITRPIDGDCTDQVCTGKKSRRSLPDVRVKREADIVLTTISVLPGRRSS